MSWFRPLQNPDHPDVARALDRVCPICHANPQEPCVDPYTGVVHHERAYPLSLGTSGDAKALKGRTA